MMWLKAKSTDGFSRRLLHCAFELLAGVKRHDSPGCDRDDLTRFGIATRACGLVPDLEIAKPGELDHLPSCQRVTNFFEKRVHNVLGLSFVQADTLEQHFSQFSFGQSACVIHDVRVFNNDPSRASGALSAVLLDVEQPKRL